MQSNEFNALLKGDLLNHPLYNKYYQGNSIRIENETLETITINDIEHCAYDVYLDNIELLGSMYLNGGSFKRIELSQVKSINESGIYINKSNIDFLNIDRKSQLAILRIAGGKVNRVHLSNADVDRVYLTERCDFTDFFIVQTNVKNGVMIWNGVFKNLSVSNNSVGNAKVAYISTLDFLIENFNLTGGASVDRVQLRRGTCDNLVIDSPEVKEVITTRIIENKLEAPLILKKIELKNLGKISLTLSDIQIGHIVFNRYFAAKESSFNLINLIINKLEFNHCINIGEFILANLTMPSGSELIINSSDLGKMSFFNSNIKSAKITFSSSKITGIFISATEISKKIIASNEGLRSFYSQMKKVYESKGDLVTSSYFYSKEMDSYNKSLNWDKDFGEKINVLLNKASSNHGQSWVQGLFSSLTICIITYCIYLLLLGFRLNISHNDQGLFVKIWAYFFEFINPVHKADAIATSLDIKKPGSYAVMWEGFSRIPIAYFIYQLIQAFRKHGKK